MNDTYAELHDRYSLWHRLGFSLYLVDNRPGIKIVVSQPLPWFIPISMEIVKVLKSNSEEIEFNYWGWHYRCYVDWQLGLITVHVLEKRALDQPIIYDGDCLSMLIALAGQFGEDISKVAIPDFTKIDRGTV